MKILVVSLLRLGDILLSAAVLRSLKIRHPEAEIHILVNGQFKSVANLIPFVSKVYTFDRDLLQKMIGTTDHNLLEAYYRVEDLTAKLKAEGYDHVINLTHNRLSGWLTTLIGCTKTSGVVFGTNGRFSMGSRWFEYLNDHTEPGQDNVFHFVDVFHYGTGLAGTDRRIELIETSEGKDFASKAFANHSGPKIIFQVGSHEQKKTLQPERWREIALLVQEAHPDSKIFFLGSPDESSKLSDICNQTPFTPLICNLEEAFSLLMKADLLVTCDTSIKHLACGTKIKILELSIGSSEFRKTGAYTSGAVILQGKVPCAPCLHRTACHRPTHECGEKISPESVALTAGALLRQDDGAIRLLAHEFKDEVEVYKTRINTQGDWVAYKLAGEFSKEEICRWVDRVSSKLFLEGAHEKPIGEFGSEGVELKSLLQNIFPDQSWRDWVGELREVEKHLVWFEEEVTRLLKNLKDVLNSMDSNAAVRTFLNSVAQFGHVVGKNPIFAGQSREILTLVDELSKDKSAFTTVKQLREKLAHTYQLSKIEIKLVRGLQNGFMEVQ